MKERFYTLLFVFFCVLPVYAQTNNTALFTLKGQVVDSLTNETVPYATITITRTAAPQKPIKLLACDTDGKFETSLKEAGKYTMTLQSIGKRASHRSFTLTAGKPLTNLGKVYMTEDNQRLGEVTVTAQKPLVKVEIDKLTYSLEDDPEAQTSTTLDMLRKVPMITVDGDDKIQLKGSTNFKIYMNGKPSNLLSNNPSDVLKSMPANSVKSIEVITDPGAKYDAEGIGGIINIITTRNALQGYTGTLRASASTTGRVGGGGYASAKIGKVGLTANYNYNHENSPWNDSYSIREDLANDNQHYLNQYGRSKHSGPFQFGSLEGSYEIDSLNLLSVGANLFNGKMTNRSEYDVEMLSKAGNPVYQYNRNSKNTGTFGSTDINVDYQHSTHKKDEMLTFSYRFSNSPDDSKSYTDIFNVINYQPRLGYPQQNVNTASTKEHTAQLDYTTPTWKDQTLEVGGKYIFRQSNSETVRTLMDSTTGEWKDISSSDSHFKHSQHIYSAYLGYAVKVNKFGFKAGVRAEGTSLAVKFLKLPEQNFSTDYFDVVPSATLSYQLNMTQQFRLGYNMRIQRPGIWYLNPYINNSDPLNISFGNPNLDSEKSNSINLNYSMFAQKFSINANLVHTFVNNSIESYTIIDPAKPGISQTTYGNIGKKQRSMLFLYGSWNPIPLFRIYLNGGLDYTDLKSKNNNLANSGLSGRIFAGSQINLPLNFRIDLNGGYYSPQIELQGKRSPFYFIGLGVNKDFLKKKLTVSLSCQNPFWKTMKMENTSSDPTFNMTSANYRTMRDFRLSVSYRFGTLKDAIKKVKRGISNDDMKSGNNSGGQESGS
ncbi:MAG: outer membrane beta-barrel family protein [Tannerellaceae bacterium]